MMSLSSDPVKMSKWDKLVRCEIGNSPCRVPFGVLGDQVRKRLTS